MVYSARPGEPWTRHVVGPFSDTRHGCACDTDPGPLGRGDVIVVAGNPLTHLSTDRGRSWRTVDLTGTQPYRRTLAVSRAPSISALPDGRLVVGYFGFWVARDPGNTSFERISGDVSDHRWRAGLGNPGLRFRGRRVSADGGRTWVTYRLAEETRRLAGRLGP